MLKNMSNTDRIVRTLAAVVILALLLMGVIQGTVAIILSVLTVILLFTSLFAFCPLYYVLKLSTNKNTKKA
jgi:hypothetical protein